MVRERQGKGSYCCWVTIGGNWKAFKAQEPNNSEGFQMLLAGSIVETEDSTIVPSKLGTLRWRFEKV